jgi:hypothetical protein
MRFRTGSCRHRRGPHKLVVRPRPRPPSATEGVGLEAQDGSAQSRLACTNAPILGLLSHTPFRKSRGLDDEREGRILRLGIQQGGMSADDSFAALEWNRGQECDESKETRATPGRWDQQRLHGTLCSNSALLA